MTGNVEIAKLKQEPIYMESTSISDTAKRYIPMRNDAILTINVTSFDTNETIQLDETMMRRIAKYNREIEVKEIEKKIEKKKKELKKIEEKIEDREKRWEKIKEFVSNIYELPLEDDDGDYDYDLED